MRRLAVALLCACSPGLTWPTSGVQYQCSAANACPNNMTCNPSTHLCEIEGGRARILGENCKNGDDCASGNCADGVCCDTSCTGICERCDLPGLLGTCSPSPAGQDPDHECETTSQHQNCASRCDGARHCTPIPDGLQCGDCLVCDFLGQCGGCGSFACQNKACLRACTGPGDCASGAHCVGGVCVGAKSNGTACAGESECASGHCVSGLCCATSCDLQPQASCQHNGSCTAEGGACADYPSGAVCASPACSNGFLTSQRSCDGSGACGSGTSSPCPGDYACTDAATCGTTCGSDAQCRAGFFCHGGACVAHSQENGQACNVGPDCVNGHCVLGICCASACTDQGAASCGQTGACLVSGSACVTYPDGTQCRAESCSGSTYTPPASCASGSCPAAVTSTCGTTCSGASCAGSCTLGTQTGCTGGAWCRLVSSVPTCVSGAQQPGDSCALDGDCTTGHCNGGVCCASGTCCKSVPGCPATVKVCDTQSSCSGHDVSYACTTFQCLQSTPRDDGACAGVADSCGNFRDAICTTAAVQTAPTCPATCAPGGVLTDSLCDPSAYCATDGSCKPKGSNGDPCTAANQCLGGTCDSTLQICCSGNNCCNSASDCPASYTQNAVCSDPAICQGTAKVATCSSHSCGTASTASRYDAACNYSSNASDFHLCPGNFAYYCNGAALQDAAASCPTNCAHLNYFCGSACGQVSCDGSDSLCAPGFHCQPVCPFGTSCSGPATPTPACTGSCG